MRARQTAYCPYSQYAVGAALATTKSALFEGCNVEDISYGLSMCAERNAIAAAVLGGMRLGELQAIALVAGSTAPTPSGQDAPHALPCGACLQVVAEFAAAD